MEIMKKIAYTPIFFCVVLGCTWLGHYLTHGSRIGRTVGSAVGMVLAVVIIMPLDPRKEGVFMNAEGSLTG